VEATDPTGHEGARRSARTLVLLTGVAVVAYALDQGSKALVVQDLEPGVPQPVIGELLTFRYVLNSGAAFSLGAGLTWIFSLVAVAVAVFIVIFARRIRSRAWAVVFGMLLGGNLGNLTDRLFREPSFGQGHVVDFIEVIYFPAIFNLADVAIVSSMVLFVLLTLLGVGLDGRRTSTRSRAGVDAGPPAA
jgi:signal peptidase II